MYLPHSNQPFMLRKRHVDENGEASAQCHDRGHAHVELLAQPYQDPALYAIEIVPHCRTMGKGMFQDQLLRCQHFSYCLSIPCVTFHRSNLPGLRLNSTSRIQTHTAVSLRNCISTALQLRLMVLPGKYIAKPRSRVGVCRAKFKALNQSTRSQLGVCRAYHTRLHLIFCRAAHTSSHLNICRATATSPPPGQPLRGHQWIAAQWYPVENT